MFQKPELIKTILPSVGYVEMIPIYIKDEDYWCLLHNDNKWHYYEKDFHPALCGEKYIEGTPIIQKELPQYGFICANCLNKFYNNMKLE